MKKTISLSVLAILVAASTGCQRWRHQVAPPPAGYMMPAPPQEVITSPAYSAGCTSCGPAACGPQMVMPGR